MSTSGSSPRLLPLLLLPAPPPLLPLLLLLLPLLLLPLLLPSLPPPQSARVRRSGTVLRVMMAARLTDCWYRAHNTTVVSSATTRYLACRQRQHSGQVRAAVAAPVWAIGCRPTVAHMEPQPRRRCTSGDSAPCAAASQRPLLLPSLAALASCPPPQSLPPLVESALAAVAAAAARPAVRGAGRERSVIGPMGHLHVCAHN